MKKPVKTKPKKTVKNSIPIGLQEGLTKIEPGKSYVLRCKPVDIISGEQAKAMDKSDKYIVEYFEKAGAKIMIISA